MGDDVVPGEAENPPAEDLHGPVALPVVLKGLTGPMAAPTVQLDGELAVGEGEVETAPTVAVPYPELADASWEVSRLDDREETLLEFALGRSVAWAPLRKQGAHHPGAPLPPAPECVQGPQHLREANQPTMQPVVERSTYRLFRSYRAQVHQRDPGRRDRDARHVPASGQRAGEPVRCGPIRAPLGIPGRDHVEVRRARPLASPPVTSTAGAPNDGGMALLARVRQVALPRLRARRRTTGPSSKQALAFPLTPWVA